MSLSKPRKKLSQPAIDKIHLNEAIDDLRALLPLPRAVAERIDRVSVLKTAISYLKMKNRSDNEPVKTEHSNLDPTCTLQAMDMFCLILAGQGEILYATENISTTIGYPQHTLFGSSLFDFIHPDDHAVLQFLMNGATGEEQCCSMTLRFKSKQSKRTLGFATEYQNEKYKTAMLQAFMINRNDQVSIVASGTVLDRSGYPELFLHRAQSVFYTHLDLTLIHVAGAAGAEQFLGKAWLTMVGSTLYKLVHPDDAFQVRLAHTPICRGEDFETETQCIRMIRADQTYAHVTMYFIYRKAMAEKYDDTIKIIVTHYGNEDPNEMYRPRQFHPHNNGTYGPVYVPQSAFQAGTSYNYNYPNNHKNPM